MNRSSESPALAGSVPVVSIVICTMDRHAKLARCLDAVFRSIASLPVAEGQCEVVVVDQSSSELTQDLLRSRFPSVVRVRLSGPGISRARNEGILRAQAPLLLFTDDDCIPSISWIPAALHALRRDPQLAGVFGRVEPYRPGGIHPVETVAVTHHLGTSYFAVDARGWRCFALMCQEKGTRVSEPAVPHMNLGSSNNMAFRRSAFIENGAFSTSFGAGSAGFSAEDTELQYRLLCAGTTLAYEPSVIVDHDNWLDPEAALKQVDRYLRGMVGVFSWYALRGERFSWRVLAYLGEHARYAFVRCRRRTGSRAYLRDVLHRWKSLALGLGYGCALAIRSTPQIHVSFAQHRGRHAPA